MLHWNFHKTKQFKLFSSSVFTSKVDSNCCWLYTWEAASSSSHLALSWSPVIEGYNYAIASLFSLYCSRVTSPHRGCRVWTWLLNMVEPLVHLPLCSLGLCAIYFADISRIFSLNASLAKTLLSWRINWLYFGVALIIIVLLCYFTFRGCNIPTAFGIHISEEGSGVIRVPWLRRSRVKNLQGFISSVCICGKRFDVGVLLLGQEFYEAMCYKCLITLRGWEDGAVEWRKEFQSSNTLRKP